MKKENKKIIIGRWFKKAQEDESSARSILKHKDGAPSTVCFLSQQVAEKSLKALIIFFDLELEKIHDLLKLSLILEKDAVGIKELGEEFKLLNRYYIETRYVGDIPEFSWVDAERAFDSAERVKKFAIDKTI